MTITNEDRKRLRMAKAALRAAKCTCNGKHDPFWVDCPRTMCEIEVDNALAIIRGLP